MCRSVCLSHFVIRHCNQRNASTCPNHNQRSSRRALRRQFELRRQEYPAVATPRTGNTRNFSTWGKKLYTRYRALYVRDIHGDVSRTLDSEESNTEHWTPTTTDSSTPCQLIPLHVKPHDTDCFHGALLSTLFFLELIAFSWPPDGIIVWHPQALS